MEKSQAMSHPQLVRPGLVPGIHVLAPKSLGPENEKTWMAGTSPAMTEKWFVGSTRHVWTAPDGINVPDW